MSSKESLTFSTKAGAAALVLIATLQFNGVVVPANTSLIVVVQ